MTRRHWQLGGSWGVPEGPLHAPLYPPAALAPAPAFEVREGVLFEGIDAEVTFCGYSARRAVLIPDRWPPHEAVRLIAAALGALRSAVWERATLQGRYAP